MSAQYAPGRAAALASERVLVVLDRELDAAAAAGLWATVAASADLGSILGALAAACGASLTSLPDFAVAVAEPGGIRLALRGAIVARAEDHDAVSAAGVTTWVERVLSGATGVEVALGDASAEAALPLAAGVVFASRIVWTAETATDAAPPAPPSVRSAPVPVDPVQAVPTAAPEPDSSRFAAATGLIDSAAVLSAATGHTDPADTLLPIDTGLGPQQADEPAPSDTTGYDHLWGATIVRSVEDAAVRPEEELDEPESPSALETAGDHDGATISIAQARALRGAAPEPLAPPRPPAPARIRLSTGQVLSLDRTVVIGRRPRSTRVSGTDLPHLVAVESPQQDISRSHLELRVEAGAVVVTDLHTTNGSMLLRAGSDPVRLHPGESTVVVIGDVIDLGDGVTVTIEDLS